MSLLKRLISSVLVLELVIQPIFAVPSHASNPELKQEGGFSYYQVQRPSQARDIPLPEGTLFASDLDLTLLQCNPDGRAKYITPAYEMDHDYTDWIRAGEQNWIALTARHGGFYDHTLEQLSRIRLKLQGLRTLLGDGHVISFSTTRFLRDSLLFAMESGDETKYKGICLRRLLDKLRQEHHISFPGIMVIDDNLDELREIQRHNPDQKFTFVHVNHKTPLRGYPKYNRSFPETIFDLEHLDTLYGGAGGAFLMQDYDGRKFVLKPMGCTHELFGELAYRALGEKNPDVALYWHLPYSLNQFISTGSGPYRLAEYVEALPNPRLEEILRQSALRLVVDAFFYNHDTVIFDGDENDPDFRNQILGVDGLLHPVDLGACGTFVHEGRHREGIKSLTETIDNYQELLPYRKAAMASIFQQMESLLEKLPGIFQAFEVAKPFGMLYANELEQFLGSRARMLEHRVKQMDPQVIWQGPCLSGFNYGGAGVYLLYKDNILLGLRRNTKTISNPGGFCEDFHRYPHVTAAHEVHEETVGGISLDPVKLLDCPRINHYVYRSYEEGGALSDLFRYTIFMYRLDELNLPNLNELLTKGQSAPEHELSSLFLMPFQDLLGVLRSHEDVYEIEGQEHNLFTPFAISARPVAQRKGLAQALLDFDNPISVDIFGGDVCQTPLHLSQSNDLYPNLDAAQGLYLKHLLEREVHPGFAWSEGKSLGVASSIRTLQILTTDPSLSIWSMIREALATHCSYYKPDDRFVACLEKMVAFEASQHDKHFVCHGTSTNVGFQWYMMSRLNHILGSPTPRFRASEGQIADISSAQEFVAHMFRTGAFEEHYTPGHGDSWMAVGLSLFHCLQQHTSSPIYFFYKGESRTALGSNYSVLRELYENLKLSKKAVDSLLASYTRIYRKFFGSTSSSGTLLQLAIDPERINDVLYLTGDNGIPVAHQDGSMVSISDYLYASRRFETYVPLRAKVHGKVVDYDYTDVRGQLYVSPSALYGMGAHYYFWPPLSPDQTRALEGELDNVIKTQLFAILPRMIMSPILYKQLPPIAQRVQEQFQLPQQIACLSDMASKASRALVDGDLGTVFELLSSNRSLRYARFFHEPYEVSMSLEEFAKDVGQEHSRDYLEDLRPYLNYLYDFDREEVDRRLGMVDQYVPHLRPFLKVLVSHYIGKRSQETAAILDFVKLAARMYHAHYELMRMIDMFTIAIDMGFEDPLPYMPAAISLYEEAASEIDEDVAKVACWLQKHNGKRPQAMESLIPAARLGRMSSDFWSPYDMCCFIDKRADIAPIFFEKLEVIQSGVARLKPLAIKLLGVVVKKVEDINAAFDLVGGLSARLFGRLGLIFHRGGSPNSTLIHVQDMDMELLRVFSSIISAMKIERKVDVLYGVNPILAKLLGMHKSPHGKQELQSLIQHILRLAAHMSSSLSVRLVKHIVDVELSHKLQPAELQQLWANVMVYLSEDDLNSEQFTLFLRTLLSANKNSFFNFDLGNKRFPLYQLLCEGIALMPNVRMAYFHPNPEWMFPFISGYAGDGLDESLRNAEMIATVMGMARKVCSEHQFEALADLCWEKGRVAMPMCQFLSLPASQRTQMWKEHPTHAKHQFQFMILMADLFCKKIYAPNELQRIISIIEAGKTKTEVLWNALAHCKSQNPQTRETLVLQHLEGLLAAHPVDSSYGVFNDREAILDRYESLERYWRALGMIHLDKDPSQRGVSTTDEIWRLFFFENFLPVLAQIDFNTENSIDTLEVLIRYCTERQGSKHDIEYIMANLPTDPDEQNAWAKGLGK